MLFSARWRTDADYTDATERPSLIKIHEKKKKKEVIASKQSERTGCIPAVISVEHNGASSLTSVSQWK